MMNLIFCRNAILSFSFAACWMSLGAETTLQAPSSVNESASEKGRENLLMLMSGEWVTRALYVAAKMEIADILLDGPKPIQELAALTQSHPESLNRILHMLAGFGIFEELENGVFSNNSASTLLTKSSPDSLHAVCIFYGEDMHIAWDQFLWSIHSGVPAFQLLTGQPVFGYFKDNPERAALFQEAMKEKSTAVIKSALSSFNFGQFNSIYDIGGGYGYFLSAILAQHPHIKGMVFDLVDVVHAIPTRNPQIATHRFEMCAGDFFDSIPPGADAYLLKSILHDWDDARAEQILKNCHQAMDANSRLLIVEVVLLPKDQSVYANCMDILMLAITGGKERSLASFEQMLENTGFVLDQVHPTATEFSILEVRKKSSDPIDQ